MIRSQALQSVIRVAARKMFRRNGTTNLERTAARRDRAVLLDDMTSTGRIRQVTPSSPEPRACDPRHDSEVLRRQGSPNLALGVPRI